MSVHEMPFLADAAAARQYLESRRWPQGVVCPHCVSRQAGRLTSAKTRAGLWKCGGCRRQFTVTVQTMFEDTKIPLHKWLQALVLLSTSRHGFSARELQLSLALSYKTAWRILDRLRYAFRRPRRKKSAPATPLPESLYPRSLDAIVDRMLLTIPERKDLQALERAALRLHK
jgi:transposase-like protein